MFKIITYDIALFNINIRILFIKNSYKIKYVLINMIKSERYLNGILLDNKSEKEINVWNFVQKQGFKI